jgi:hypothetical protein
MSICIRLRDFIAARGAVAWPLAVRAKIELVASAHLRGHRRGIKNDRAALLFCAGPDSKDRGAFDQPYARGGLT